MKDNFALDTKPDNIDDLIKQIQKFFFKINLTNNL